MIRKLLKLGREKNLASLLSNVSVAFSGLLSFVLLTRQLPKESFGDWVLFITLATFVDLLRFGLTRTAAVRELSGADKLLRKRLLGATFRINLALVLGISVLCWGSLFLVKTGQIQLAQGYYLFLVWYPLLALANLSWNNALALFQAEQNFKRMMYVRLSNVVLFLIFLVFNYWFFHYGLTAIIVVNIAVNFISGVACTLKKWDGLFFLGYARRDVERRLVNFGKYSMGTLISSSLLKSADTFIIGLSPFLGSAGIAMYAIPLKLTDLLGIPLHSFSMTAYPRMSKKCLEGDFLGARSIFYTYSGAVTLLFLPVALVSFVFAEELILLLGGTEYKESLPLLAAIFRVFTVYVLLLPIDRFTGVLLDSLNKPKYNLYKVLFMASANILVDLLAVFVFKSLIAVAIGTVFFTLLGIFLGFFYVRKELQVHIREMFLESILFLKNLKSNWAP